MQHVYQNLTTRLLLCPDPLHSLTADFSGDSNVFDCPILLPDERLYDSAQCTCRAGFQSGGNPSQACSDLSQSGELSDECRASGRFECTACPSGSFSPLPWSETCTPCSPGSFSDSEASTSCSVCQAGSHQDGFGAESCISCPSGSFQDQENSTSCLDCAPGSFSPHPGSLTCSLCEPGTNQTLSGMSSCSPCPENTYQSEEGALECVACPEFSFSVTPGSTECTQCDASTSHLKACQGFCMPGEHLDSATGQCDICPRGTYSSEPGATECIPCAPGTYTDTPGSHHCKVCSSGTYQSELGGDSCNPCSPGLFQPAEHSSSCLPCASGSFSLAGATTCSACSAGTNQSTPASPSCSSCPDNTYQPEQGALTCLSCPELSFTESRGATGCTPCDDTTTSVEACSSYCLPGYYYDLTDNAGNGGGCQKCLPGYYSLGGRSPCMACPGDNDDNVDAGLPEMCTVASSGHKTEYYAWALLLMSFVLGGVAVGSMFCVRDHLRGRRGVVHHVGGSTTTGSKKKSTRKKPNSGAKMKKEASGYRPSNMQAGWGGGLGCDNGAQKEEDIIDVVTKNSPLFNDTADDCCMMMSQPQYPDHIALTIHDDAEHAGSRPGDAYPTMLPPGEVVGEHHIAAPTRADVPEPGQPRWVKAFDQASQRSYYYVPETGAVRWGGIDGAGGGQGSSASWASTDNVYNEYYTGPASDRP